MEDVVIVVIIVTGGFVVKDLLYSERGLSFTKTFPLKIKRCLSTGTGQREEISFFKSAIKIWWKSLILRFLEINERSSAQQVQFAGYLEISREL